jgi:hypothetical protein
MLGAVSEIVLVLYPNVDRLMANGNKILAKTPPRIELFEKEAPYPRAPHHTHARTHSTPVIASWGTWCWALLVDERDMDCASCIVMLQEISKYSN